MVANVLACVASVSFSIFDRARIGASAKRGLTGEGGGEEGNPSHLNPLLALAPILARSKIEKVFVCSWYARKR